MPYFKLVEAVVTDEPADPGGGRHDDDPVARDHGDGCVLGTGGPPVGLGLLCVSQTVLLCRLPPVDLSQGVGGAPGLHDCKKKRMAIMLHVMMIV